MRVWELPFLSVFSSDSCANDVSIPSHVFTSASPLTAVLTSRCVNMMATPGTPRASDPDSNELGIHAVGTPVRVTCAAKHRVRMAFLSES